MSGDRELREKAKELASQAAEQMLSDDTEEVLSTLHDMWIRFGDSKYREGMASFAIHESKAYGVRLPTLRIVSTALRKAIRKKPEAGRELLERMWKSDIYENRMVTALSAGTLGLQGRRVEDLLEKFIKESGNWAICDTLSTDSVQSLLEADPDNIYPMLERWSVSDELWLRRASAATLAAHGLRIKVTDDERFFRILSNLMTDGELYVKKAVSWALRNTTKRHGDQVYRFMTSWATKGNEHTRWILRDGSTKLPSQQRQRLMTGLAD